jgi:microcystin degradation protein MlrC
VAADGVVRGWTGAVRYARALVVDPAAAQAALVGGFGPDHDLVTVGRLGDGELEPTSTGRLTQHDGTELAAGTTWSKLDLGSFAFA